MPKQLHGRGDCRGSPGSVGQCQCHMIDDHFGYGGESCEANCGSKTISPPFSLNTQSPPDLDCYCRNNAIEGRKDAGNDMVAKSYTTRGIGPFGCVYGCNGDHKACNPHVPGYDTVVDLHCQYGELASCENNNNASSGGVGLPASRASVSGACSKSSPHPPPPTDLLTLLAATATSVFVLSLLAATAEIGRAHV